VIRNCHDERVDNGAAPDLRAILGLTAQDRLCVVVGNWKPGMAIAIAADALALLPSQFRLAFVGHGYAEQAQRLRLHPAAARLHFGHYTEPNRVVPFISSADIGLVIYTPYSENYQCALPNGFFQTIAAGLPLVRMPLPEIEATIAGRAIGICLARSDSPTLARALLRCAERPETFRSNAAVLARTLRWELEGRRLQELVADLLGSSAAREAAAAPATVEA
jgi:glycosyltransferase involved in cell wall biosynthesis